MHNGPVELRFTQATRKHRIGRAHVRYVIASVTPTPIETNNGDPAWLYVGPDERGVELEVIAVEKSDGALVIIHVFPTALRSR